MTALITELPPALPDIVSVWKNPLISLHAMPDALAETTTAVAPEVAPVIDSPLENVVSDDESTRVPFAKSGVS